MKTKQKSEEPKVFYGIWCKAMSRPDFHEHRGAAGAAARIKARANPGLQVHVYESRSIATVTLPDALVTSGKISA
jgi:hypothetical protein